MYFNLACLVFTTKITNYTDSFWKSKLNARDRKSDFIKRMNFMKVYTNMNACNEKRI